jgi:outer membrane protein
MDRIRRTMVVGVGLVSMVCVAGSVAAAETGDWVVRAGASIVAPDSDNGELKLSNAIPAPNSDIEVDDAPGFTINVSYFFTPNVAIELLAAYPFTHDFELEDVNLEGEVDHLPPTLSLQYHFPINETVKPYVGAGINWTLFSNEDVDAPVDVSIDDSIGLAVQAGIDFQLNERWLLNVDVRYINIEGDVEVAGTDVGTVEINPLVYGVHIGYTI